MKKTPDERGGTVSLRALCALAVLWAVPVLLLAVGPQWWIDRGVLDPGAAANDYAPANQGQVKNFALAAYQELQTDLPAAAWTNAAGTNLTAFATHLATLTNNNYAPINLGQLKALAQPFYDQLIAVGYTTNYPWSTATNAPSDYAIVNIGQVKNLFSFDLAAFTHPVSPSNVDATRVSDTEVDLTWTLNTPYAIGIQISRSLDNGQTWQVIATLPITVTSYADTTLTANQHPQYQIAAIYPSLAGGGVGNQYIPTSPIPDPRAAPRYAVISIDLPGYDGLIQPIMMNTNGQVACNYTSSNAPYYGGSILWSRGESRVIQNMTYAGDLGEDGTVVGSYWDPSASGPEYIADVPDFFSGDPYTYSTDPGVVSGGIEPAICLPDADIPDTPLIATALSPYTSPIGSKWGGLYCIDRDGTIYGRAMIQFISSPPGGPGNVGSYLVDGVHWPPGGSAIPNSNMAMSTESYVVDGTVQYYQVATGHTVIKTRVRGGHYIATTGNDPPGGIPTYPTVIDGTAIGPISGAPWIIPQDINESGGAAVLRGDDDGGEQALLYWDPTHPQLLEENAFPKAIDNDYNVIGSDLSGHGKLWSADPEITGSYDGLYHAIDLNRYLPKEYTLQPGVLSGHAIAGNGTYQAYNSDGTPNGAPVNKALIIFPGELGVDADRDGQITLNNEHPSGDDGNGHNVDKTTQAKPFRFWVNNNEDQPSSSILFGTSPDTVPTNSGGEDYRSNDVVSIRDLEDWTRLWFYTKGLNQAIHDGTIKVGLKWISPTGTPGLKVITASDADGGTEYLSDTTAATTQRGQDPNDPGDSGASQSGAYGRLVLKDANDSHTNIVPTGGAADFVFPQWVWTNLSDTAPKTHFLFEGTGRGQGQLQIVFLKSDGTTLLGQGGNLWLDLRDIKEMYQRAIAAGAGPSPTPPTPPYVSNNGAFADGSIGTNVDTTNPFVAPSDETKQCTIFVHGWYTDYNGFLDYSETMFKRLWWQGYKGRFVGYTWPALSGPSTYNTSEWNAWLYARAFKNYVNGIKGNFTLVTVAAHSQGNIVVSAAIQEGLSVNQYILMQAAMPTALYTTASTSDDQYNVYPALTNSNSTPDLAANLGYRNFIAPAKGNVGSYYCFYNPLDFALQTGSYPIIGATSWLANQLGYKPDGNPAQLGAGFYSMVSNQPNFTRVSGGIPISDRPLTEAHESMSFVARPRSQAAGADPNSSIVFGHATDLHATYGFDTTLSDHSGQFRRDYDQVYALYQTLKAIIAPPVP